MPLPPLKRALLKDRPWYERHRGLTVIVATVCGVGIFYSRLIYDIFSDTPSQELFPMPTSETKQRIAVKNKALDNIHHFLGASPEKVQEYRTKEEKIDKHIRELREKRMNTREELAKLQAAEGTK
ncbi:uncharacterized protein LOC103509374 isoform X1 [Diaphorina citri]|uniref:Uncharacterized protein LOC103509374 isoform X1 n=1 Tax=Diaphorina citri TaxID=121845 RepID=A0A1S3D1C9_DIACI|nr:uncharacterized protein LOC103509374 isoform X1 [Diaphorina citri]XP_008472209.1 uncharacterized protein LOC103509374 isoform X1 [Diaphorina citri]